jgi:hypothetical protein
MQSTQTLSYALKVSPQQSSSSQGGVRITSWLQYNVALTVPKYVFCTKDINFWYFTFALLWTFYLPFVAFPFWLVERNSKIINYQAGIAKILDISLFVILFSYFVFFISVSKSLLLCLNQKL